MNFPTINTAASYSINNQEEMKLPGGSTQHERFIHLNAKRVKERNV